MCALGYIFQAKVYKILGDIEGIKNYIYDILVLSKEIFANHIDQIRVIFARLHASGMIVTAPKFSFWLKNIPYLCYVITRKGVKLNPKKVQGIMDLRRTATTT